MQNVIALLIVAAAFGYIGWRGWTTIAAKRKSAGCGSCGSCPNTEAGGATIKPLITIQPLAANKK
jgi:FeoB-associated Cys-rich membrane protein